MGIGLSGLTSGMDTDAVIEAMVMSKTEKKNQLVKSQKKLEWKMDAWKELNSKIYSFYTKSLSNMRMIGSYNKKVTSVSDPSVAKITASSGSVNGTQTLAITQLAKSGYLTGGEVKRRDADGNVVDGRVASDTKLSELGVEKGSINISVAGKQSVLTIDGDTTVSDFVNQLKDAGVNASFDATNQRFFISAKDSGVTNDFSLTAADGNGIDNLKKLGLYTEPTEKDVEQYRKWAGYSSDDISKLLKEDYENQKFTADKVKEGFLNDIKSWETSNENLRKTNEKSLNNKKLLEYQRDYANMYKAADGSQNSYYNDVKASIDEYKSRIDAGETLSEEEQKKYEDLQLQMSAIQTVDKAIGDDAKNTPETRQKYIDNLTEQIEKAADSIKKNEERIAENQKNIDEKQEIISTDEKLAAYVDEQNKALDEKLTEQYKNKWETAKNFMIQYDYLHNNKVSSIDGSAISVIRYNQAKVSGDITASNATDGTGAVRIAGQNAEIYLNDARFVSDSNTFNVNGLTITAQELTGDSKDDIVSITTSQDTEAVYNMVKDFFKGYNELINEMDKLYNAGSAKGYEPLTNEEKAAMTDKEIELWEEKVKGSLLRRDASLNNIIQVMKNSMARGIDMGNGKRGYLSQLGIETGGYLYAAENERGAYHIDGDEDDTLFSSKDNKLMDMLVNDPDQVAQVLSGIASNLYSSMTTAMRSTSLSSSYTAYNDKQMKIEYDSYTEKIAAQEEKITWWEDYYRSKFTTMEKMLSSLNQQQSSLSGLFGA